jgi:lipopolysaccharide/colanic/teichoic acid biosynthesis glycosyltransferase
MTTYKTTTIPIGSAFEPEQQDVQFLRCTLKWRQEQLLLSLEQPTKQPYLPALTNEQLLVECLKYSQVKLIRIDVALGEVCLKFWADACEKASKVVFVRLPPNINMSKRRRLPAWWLKRLLDLSIAALLLMVLCPVMIGLFCLLRMQSSEPIFLRQWHVGERGKLFRLFKFRTTSVNTLAAENELMGGAKKILKRQDNLQLTTLGYWMHKYKLDELPQLFNILRGDMSLTEPRPLNLEQVVRRNLEERQKINTL